MKRLFLTILAGLSLMIPCSGREIFLNSHNDYARTAPFWEAYAFGMNSVEVDIFDIEGKLLVGHDLEDLSDERNLEDMYIKPYVSLARKDKDFNMILLIELKSSPEQAMKDLTAALVKYPDVFGGGRGKVIITGRVPSPECFRQFPPFFSFDAQTDIRYSPEQLERIAFFSADFSSMSCWNGKGALLPKEEAEVRKLIDKVHAAGKAIRFWGVPESVTMYYTMAGFGVDWINSDKPAECASYFADRDNKEFRRGNPRDRVEGVTTTHKLDKATNDFEGFRNSRLVLPESIGTYTPTYASDASEQKVKNVIFLIGDGMGLNQISSGMYVNGGLSLLNMKHIGLQQNNSSDQFTTDSAASGSALATGESHMNRHIAMRPDSTSVESLTEWCHRAGMKTGVITFGDIFDATPSAFFGHSCERDAAEEISEGLLGGYLDLLCGCTDMDMSRFRQDFTVIHSSSGLDSAKGRVICTDKAFEKATGADNMNLLADATRRALRKLDCDEGFFLMVEGAKIDYAGHSKCLPGVVLEMLGFDLAVSEALRFADSHPNTLVVVTGDHETGGLALLDGNTESGSISGMFITDDHTPALIPVFSYGPHSDSFIGKYKNIHIPLTIKKLLEK